MAIKTEKDVMLNISNWMSMFNIDIWWNQKNEKYPTFKTVGKNRSDLLIRHQNKNYIIECKKADHKKNIYDAFFQTLNYAKNETSYIIDNQCIEINGYVIGTEHSINGRLFDKKFDLLMTEIDFGKSRLVGIQNGEIPKTEYSMTEAICRLLWRGIPEYNLTIPIGVLVSDILNHRNITPLLLMKDGKQQFMKVLR